MPYDSRATLVTRLTAVRTAIENARTAQSYGVGDRNQRRGDLKVLLEEEKMLLGRIEAIDRASDGWFNKARFRRPI